MDESGQPKKAPRTLAAQPGAVAPAASVPAGPPWQVPGPALPAADGPPRAALASRASLARLLLAARQMQQR